MEIDPPSNILRVHHLYVFCKVEKAKGATLLEPFLVIFIVFSIKTLYYQFLHYVICLRAYFIKVSILLFILFLRRYLVKRIFLVLSMLVLAVSIHAQVKSHVAIVKPTLAEPTKEFLLQLAKSMHADGYKDAAAYLEAWAEGGFGSGFVYVDPKTGDNYIITNRHVVAQAEKATLEFENEDGATVSYKDCEVVAVSEDLDLALLAFPSESKPFSFGISFAKSLPDDGSDIWSAGFPGLLSRPSWQFGKGNVTNNRVKVPELSASENATFIQHSAPIDGGSSGGPLLIIDKTSRLGYSVVGINTWKILGRQDTNFAVPTASITEFLNNALLPSKDGISEIITARAKAFSSSIYLTENAYKKLSPFISHSLITKYGEDALKQALNRAPTAIRNDIIETFVGISPLDGLRLATAWVIINQVTADDSETLKFQELETPSENEVIVNFQFGERAIISSWAKEHGLWRILSFPFEVKEASSKDKKKKSEGTSNFEIGSPFSAIVSGGATLSFDDDKIFLANLEYRQLTTVDYVAWLMGGGVGTMDIENDPSCLILATNFGFIVQVPLLNNSFNIIPYIKASAGVFIPFSLVTSSDFGFTTTFSGGGSLIHTKSGFGLGAEYSFLMRHSLGFGGSFFDDDDESEKTSNNHLLSVYLIYAL